MYVGAFTSVFFTTMNVCGAGGTALVPWIWENLTVMEFTSLCFALSLLGSITMARHYYKEHFGQFQKAFSCCVKKRDISVESHSRTTTGKGYGATSSRS